MHNMLRQHSSSDKTAPNTPVRHSRLLEISNTNQFKVHTAITSPHASHSTIPSPAPTTLQRVPDPARKVLQDIGNIADSVAVREEIPAASAVAVVVEPGAEDEVGGDDHEQAEEGS